MHGCVVGRSINDIDLRTQPSRLAWRTVSRGTPWVCQAAARCSSARPDEAGLRIVIEHLKASGAKFHPVRKSGLRRTRPTPPPETEPQVRKIRTMLAQDGLPDVCAEAILQRMCSHPHRVLRKWASSKQLGDGISALLYRG